MTYDEWFMPLEPTALEPQELQLIVTALTEMQQRRSQAQHDETLAPGARERAGAEVTRIDVLLERLEVP